MRILGIETSCDETAVAIVTYDDDVIHVVDHVVSSQIAKHQVYGGVVPEVAARLHVPVLPKLIEAMTSWKRDGIDAIAVTAGPGLATSLRVGIEAAKALSLAWNLPLVPIDHMEGHIYANLIDLPTASNLFPVLCLIVSGGHTELVLMRDHGVYEMVGQTRDDAAGEAFDKTAAQLGLPYPGGPHVSKAAEQGRVDAIDFPRPMLESGDFDFSFSGLKTAVKQYLTTVERTEQVVADVSASFEQAVVDVLIQKTRNAAETFAPRSVFLCGGVSANRRLREALVAAFADTDVQVLIPSMTYTTDNAAMIAAAGAVRFARMDVARDRFVVDADPSHRLGTPWKWEI